MSDNLIVHRLSIFFNLQLLAQLLHQNALCVISMRFWTLCESDCIVSTITRLFPP